MEAHLKTLRAEMRCAGSAMNAATLVQQTPLLIRDPAITFACAGFHARAVENGNPAADGTY